MSTSVRKENRWRKNLKAENDAADRIKREVEAAHMVRSPRPPTIAPAPNATKQQVRSWMRRTAPEFDTATELCEAANAALQLPPDAMDDETHWIWDEAVSALEWAAV